ncbi:MAG TPA: methyltransferase [Candidatus Binataceae bacterium]|nr:methyltransferase [Candidatus Binataceae bacterium]
MAPEKIAGDLPDTVMAIAQGHTASAALKAAVDLELFTHIAHGLDTAEKLAGKKGTPLRSMRILCNALVSFGMLRKSGGRYELPAAVSAMLVKGSPGYMGGMMAITGSRTLWNELARLSDVVKAGHTLIETGSAEAADNPFWEDFARGSRLMAQMTGPIIADTLAPIFGTAGPRRVLDIACGSGFYGISVLKKFPEARLTSVDWAKVLKVAELNARQAGVADRVEFRPADVFNDDLGSGYDLVMAVNIYHHFSPDKCIELSRRLHDAAAPGAHLAMVDMIPDESREKNQFALAFALTMLIWTHEGDTYTLSEYRKILESGGWHDIEFKPVSGPMPSQLIIAKQ